MGLAALVAPKGLGPQDLIKKLPHWTDLLGQVAILTYLIIKCVSAKHFLFQSHSQG